MIKIWQFIDINSCDRRCFAVGTTFRYTAAKNVVITANCLPGCSPVMSVELNSGLAAKSRSGYKAYL